MDAKLSVEVGAKIDALTTAMAQAEKSVSDFAVNADGSLVKFGKSINTLERQLKTFQSGLKNTIDPSRITLLNNAIKVTEGRLETTRRLVYGTGEGVKKFGQSTVSAGYAASNFGRVLQDIPFGLIAIQNNIIPLAESLGATGGLTLALSLATAAATLWFQATEKSSRAAKEAAKDNKVYADTLDDVNKAQLRGAQSAAEDTTNLNLLFGAYQNANLPLSARKDAYKQLQDLYPAYFGNLKFEREATVAQVGAYERLTEVILASAKARSASELIGKNTSRQLENGQKILDLERERIKLDIKATQLEERSLSASRGTGEANERIALNVATQALSAREKEQDVQRDINNLKTDSNILTNRNLDLVKFTNQELEKGAVLGGSIGGADPEKIKTVADVYKDLQTQLVKIKADVSGTFGDKITDQVNAYKKAINDLIDLGIKPASEAIQNLQGGIENLTTGGLGGIKLPKVDVQIFSESFQNLPKIVQQQLHKTLEFVNEFGKEVDSIINTGLVAGFEDIGNAIGGALATGGNLLQAFGNSVLSTIGDILIQFGKLAIKTGITALAIKAAITNPFGPGGGAAIIAGIALVAAGALAKGVSAGNSGNKESAGGSRARKIPGFASGIENFKGGLAYVHAGEVLTNLAPGTNVIPANRVSAMGKGGDTISASLGISMREFVLEIRREEKLIGRIG